MAQKLGIEFISAERVTSNSGEVRYRIPESMCGSLNGRRVLIVDDAVSPGYALEESLYRVQECGGVVVGLAALISVGAASKKIGSKHNVPFPVLAEFPGEIWAQHDCPLCNTCQPITLPYGKLEVP